MNRQDAEKIITEYLKPIFGFALKRCKNAHDAEDLSQDIVLKAFRALLIKDDIGDVSKFIWTIAHNALSNYYRDTAKSVIGVSIDEVAEVIADPDSIFDDNDNADTIRRLQSEIAYLSKLQRRIIIAYYFENRKQADIAKDLDIPLGTVKWHLFEAKKELKRGMDTMRKASELKFNPIKFDLCGFNGFVGTEGSPSKFFNSLMAQNIEYSVWKEAKTINKIADELGVSPVYVESEAERLEEYGLLTKTGDRYLCNILLGESTDELNRLHDKMYSQAAEIFANELFDELTTSGILDDSKIWGGSTEPFTFTYDPPKDKNFMLWALIPYIAALSGDRLMDNGISFEEAATPRPDGGNNICYASIIPHDVEPPMYFDSMKRFFGPYWNGFDNKFKVWSIDSQWSERRADDDYRNTVSHDLSLLNIYLNGDDLSAEGYAYLVERGYISLFSSEVGEFSDVTAKMGDSFISNKDLGNYKIKFRCLCLADGEINDRLIAIGDRIKEKYRSKFEELKKEYVDADLRETPKHLHTMEKYGLQYIFHSDAWFILHCIKALLANGKLKEPTEEQKRSLSTIIIQK
ncbi:MAG: sigma-70 family RNA polymerase sigma factor [Clostridia bacterium]|nr:sigma-70 family RNA polymerase sigma factor [Clostridia bacterium]